jgi:hypothetical protein
MAFPRRVAAELLRAMLRLSPEQSREWASAMLQELEFVEGDWEALFWALGCATAIFRRSGRPILSWVIRQLGFEEGKMSDFQRRAVGLFSGIGIAIVLTVCFMIVTHLSGHIFGFDHSPWMIRVAAIMAGVLEVVFVASVIALWRNRRPMAVGVLVTALLLGTHFAMYISTHLR